MTDKMTNREALSAAIDLAKAAGMDELTYKLSHMLAMADKASAKRSATLSKTQVQNNAILDELVAAMRDYPEPITIQWVQEHIRYCTSPQKATAILTRGRSLGLIEKAGHGKGGRVLYKLAE